MQVLTPEQQYIYMYNQQLAYQQHVAYQQHIAYQQHLAYQQQLEYQQQQQQENSQENQEYQESPLPPPLLQPIQNNINNIGHGNSLNEFALLPNVNHGGYPYQKCPYDCCRPINAPMIKEHPTTKFWQVIRHNKKIYAEYISNCQYGMQCVDTHCNYYHHPCMYNK